MKIVKNNGSENMIAVGEKFFFFNQTDLDTQVLPVNCPHRNGPLHLGKMTEKGRVVTCPWHENKYSVCNLEKKALPSVKISDTINIVVSKSDEVRFWYEKLPVAEAGCPHEN